MFGGHLRAVQAQDYWSSEFGLASGVSNRAGGDVLAGRSGCSCGSSGCSSCGTGSCGPIFDERYFSLFGGFTNVDNFERTLSTPTATFIDGANLRSGHVFGGAIGGVVRQFIRTEIEFTFRSTDVNSVFSQEFDLDGVLVADARDPATGQVDTYSGMYNVVFDVGKRCVGTPHLYIGGGLGAIYADGAFDSAAESFAVSDSSFAYQFIAGLNMPVRSHVDLYTEYRYLGADNLQVENLTLGTSMGDYTYDSHSVLFGARFRR